MTRSAVLLGLDALAVFRLTRLIVEDTITSPVRERLVGKPVRGKVGRPRLAVFITCPWCVSPYLAAIVVALQMTVPATWLPVSAVLAFSAVTGLLAEAG